MQVNIEPVLLQSRRALIKNPGDDAAKSLLSWCVFHLQETKADMPAELVPYLKKLGGSHE